MWQLPTRSPVLVSFLVALLAAVGAILADQSEPPLSEADLVRLLEGGVTPARVASLVGERGVDFQLTPEIELRLRRAGADDGVIAAVFGAALRGTWEGTMRMGAVSNKVNLDITHISGAESGLIRIVEGSSGRVLEGPLTPSVLGRTFKIEWKVPYGEGVQMVGAFLGTLSGDGAKFEGEARYRLLSDKREELYQGTVELSKPLQSSSRTAAGESTGAAASSQADPNDPLQPHDPGIYWLATKNGNREMVSLEPSVYSQGKTGSLFTSAMTYGLARSKWKAVVRSPRAVLRIKENQPQFWFYFEVTSHTLSYSGFFAPASSPNEFILARMEQKKNERELVVAEMGASGMSVGTRAEDTVPIQFEKVAPGVYKVVPGRPLGPGEYCFFYGGTSMAWGAGGAKLFDFGIETPHQ